MKGRSSFPEVVRHGGADMDVALGIDVGSVSTKIAALDERGRVAASSYFRTGGDPIRSVQNCLRQIGAELGPGTEVGAVGSTGSARGLAGVLAGADLVRNEITCHAVAAAMYEPDVRTVIEIGGQDSKIIILREGIAVDFAMNTVCAAGTGSFLDHQAARLGVAIDEFGGHALRALSPVRIAGRCTVFAESDMIHKQQMGHSKENIIAGLCRALVRNYLANLGKGKEIVPPIVFQGGVAANAGIRAAFEEALSCPVTVPEHHLTMGAIGAATLAREFVTERKKSSAFKGFEVAAIPHEARSFECGRCPNNCEIVEVLSGGRHLASWGSRCGRFDRRPAPVGAGQAS
jgi:predicted CoA-substrate-specific enzyme activase